MSQPQPVNKKKSVLDYSKWDNIAVDDVHIDVQAPFNAQVPSANATSNLSDDDNVERVKIPRSPRPLPAEPPILPNDDGLLEPPPYNAPKGAAAVRHYQVGFGHNIIKKKGKSHRKAHSMNVMDQFEKFLKDKTNPLNTTTTPKNTDNNINNNSANKPKDKKYGIKVTDQEQENADLLAECGELLQFMMKEAKKEKLNQPNDNNDNDDNDNQPSFNPSHHDYYKHNPYEYYRQKAMKTHNITSPTANLLNKDIPRVDCILKIGGSFITNKNQKHTLRQDNIDIAAQQISSAFKLNYIQILIHGAGSYGHFEAKKYKLMNGLYHSESTQGMVLCRAAVSILHQHLMAKLMEYHLPVISVSPANILTSNDGIITKKQLKPFINYICRIIKNGMIPLIHGDIIFDDKRGCHILSGDIILETLCSSFIPIRSVFWSNIAGVYDTTDINNKSKLIKQINVNPQGKPILDVNIIKQLKNPKEFFRKQQDNYMKNLFKNDNTDQDPVVHVDKNKKPKKDKIIDDMMVSVDTTGGMFAKVEVASRCCAQGIDVIITKGGTKDAQLALLGKYAKRATVFVQSDMID